MRIGFRISWLIFVLVLVAGCATQVNYQYNSAPYAGWRYFSWRGPGHQRLRNPLIDSGILATRVHKAVVAVLSKRGYRQAPTSASTDFIVTYHTTLQERQVPAAADVGFVYGGWGTLPFGTVVVARPNRKIRRADLIIDIIDAKTDKLVWRGWVSRSLGPSDYSRKAVTEAVARILSKFPPSGH